MKEKLLEQLSALNELSVTYKGIKKMLGVSRRKIDDELVPILHSLEMEEKIYQDENGFFHLFPTGFRVAEIEETKNGQYYAIIDKRRQLIQKNMLNGALNNDIVIVQKKAKQCKVVKILKRKTSQVVCEVKLDEDNRKFLEPYNVGHKFNIGIGHRKLRRLIVGQRVLVGLSEEKYNDYYDGTLLQTIGYRNDPNIDLRCIALSQGFNPEYSEEAMQEVEAIPEEVQPEDLVGRLDLRKENTFTIDGEHTKDMDDAVSIRILPNGNYELGVHIAHVSHYVKKDSALFKEAYERGNSLYLLDSVIPMLPQFLSNGICSLNPGEDRLTRSVIMEIDEYGNIVNYRIVKSVINSKKKMSYEKVNEIFEEKKIPKGYEGFVSDLMIMKHLSDVLTFKRNRRGYIDFDSSEVEFKIDNEGLVNGVEVKKQQSAENLIENFMVTANTVIASNAYWQNLPFAYRNHGIPNDTKLIETIRLLSTLGYKLEKIRGIENPHVVQNILFELTKNEEYPILSTLILRAMQKAYYGQDNIGHYGLSLDCYTHFTSPIRRLVDLVIHMLLDYYEETDRLEVDQNLQEMNVFLKHVCEQASQQERSADKAEYQSYKLASVELMEERIGDTFDVYITDITSKYIKVKTEDLIEGIIPITEIGADYKYYEESRSIKLMDINKLLVIGTKIPVKLTAVSKEYREIYFSFPYLISKQEKEERIRKRFFS